MPQKLGNRNNPLGTRWSTYDSRRGFITAEILSFPFVGRVKLGNRDRDRFPYNFKTGNPEFREIPGG